MDYSTNNSSVIRKTPVLLVTNKGLIDWREEKSMCRLNLSYRYIKKYSVHYPINVLNGSGLAFS